MADRVQAATTAASRTHPSLLRRESTLSERGRLFRRRKLFNSGLVRSLAGIRGTSPLSVGPPSRNQLSTTEAACRSSRTLEGICQELHASVPTIRAEVSAPSNLRIAAARTGRTVKIGCTRMRCNEEGGIDMSPTAPRSPCCTNASRVTINRRHLKRIPRLMAS